MRSGKPASSVLLDDLSEKIKWGSYPGCSRVGHLWGSVVGSAVYEPLRLNGFVYKCLCESLSITTITNVSYCVLVTILGA